MSLSLSSSRSRTPRARPCHQRAAERGCGWGLAPGGRPPPSARPRSLRPRSFPAAPCFSGARGSHCLPAHPQAHKAKPKLPEAALPSRDSAHSVSSPVRSGLLHRKAPLHPLMMRTSPGSLQRCLARLPLQCHLTTPLQDQVNFQTTSSSSARGLGRHLLDT